MNPTFCFNKKMSFIMNKPSHSDVLTMGEFSKNMLSKKVFNCVTCEKLLTPPIMLVQDFGNICSNCFSKRKFNGIRNEALEIILSESIVPCGYGCNENMNYKKLAEHYAVCKYRPIECLITNCRQQCLLDNFTKHFTENHSEHVISDEDGIFIVNINLFSNNICIKLLNGKLKTYFLKVKNNTEADNMSCAMFQVEDTSGTAESNYSIHLFGVGKQKMKVECEVQSLRTLNENKKSTEISMSSLKNMIDVDNFVTLMIKSQKNEMSEVFKKYLECPICNEIMRRPIYQCMTGHSVCESCQSKVHNCPTCRNMLSQTRNFALEDLTNEIIYECKYNSQGCKELLSGDKIEKHEATCEYHYMKQKLFRQKRYQKI